MAEKTPDQIRRETVPKKYYALTYGFLGGLLGAVLCFGGWGYFHQEQVKRYPDYAGYALRSEFAGFSLFPTKHKPGMSDDQLRYNLLRFGNEDHRFDAQIIRRGWYPKGENGRVWVFYNGAVKPVYAAGVLMVFQLPLALTLLTCIAAFVYGAVGDYKYRSAITAGIPLDGSIVATVNEYQKEVKGDGMAYVVNPWKDR
jgi:hypothetical protein